MLIIFLVFIIIISIIAIVYNPVKRAGNKGERYVNGQISKLLNSDDFLFTNIKIKYGNLKTELDNLIINNNGVFIIEVKNYSGTLQGQADENNWVKEHYSSGGNFYYKNVRNPLKQVKRQEYILANYLKENGVFVWVSGYVYFVEHNSPVYDERVLESFEDIDMLIHSSNNKKISNKDINKIINLLK